MTCRRSLAVLVGLLLAGCVRTNYNLATRQEEYTITSTDKEIEMGRALARKVESEVTVVADEPLQERVRTIGERLVAVCDRQELVYSFAVVKDEEVNAFSLPGGYVFVNEGLIRKTKSDDELASVIAHEIAHIAARHAVKRYETSLGAQLLQLASMAAVREAKAARGLGVAVQAARLAYARQDELAADRLAVRYLKAAGFEPRAILTFLDRLHELDQNKLHYLPRGVVRPQYAKTHPFVPDRIRAVKEELFGVADYIDYLNTPQ
jgi:predicted Zn-dependent protease